MFNNEFVGKYYKVVDFSVGITMNEFCSVFHLDFKRGLSNILNGYNPKGRENSIVLLLGQWRLNTDASTIWKPGPDEIGATTKDKKGICISLSQYQLVLGILVV